MDINARLLLKVPFRVMALSTSYAAALALLERKLRLKPDHEWLEVAVGVGLTLVPIAVEAHAIEQVYAEEQRSKNIDWKIYEGAVWRSFLASGAPIIFWQIGEAIVRKWELMKYLTKTDDGRSETDANTTIEMANGSGDTEEGCAPSYNGSYAVFTRGTAES